MTNEQGAKNNTPAKPKVGKTYNVNHNRKGKWTASLIEIQGAGTDDEWYVLSDDPSSPVRACFCKLTEVES